MQHPASSSTSATVTRLAGKPPAPVPQAPRTVAGWWDVQTVASVTGMSVSLIYQLLREGRFPSQVRVTPRCVRWKAQEVAAWMEAREAERQGAGTPAQATQTGGAQQ